MGFKAVGEILVLPKSTVNLQVEFGFHALRNRGAPYKQLELTPVQLIRSINTVSFLQTRLPALLSALQFYTRNALQAQIRTFICLWL